MRRASLAVVLAYFALAIIPYWSYWNAGGTMIAGKGGDPATGAWFLAWAPYALRHGHDPLVTDWGNYPVGVNAITGIGMPLLAVLGAPVTLLFGAFVTTTLLFTLAFPLSAIAAYVLVRRWVSWRPAAFAGGLLYGFSPYLAAHGGSHLNLVFVPLPPLIFLMLSKIVAGAPLDRRVCGVALGGLCVAQFLVSAEVLASTAVMGAIGLGAVALVSGRKLVRERWLAVARALGWAALVAVVLLAYPVWLMVAGPGHVAAPVQTTSLYRGNLLAPVIPDSAMYFAAAWSARMANTFSGGTSENGLYLGVPLLFVLIAGAAMLRHKPVVKVAVIVTVAAFVLTLGSRLTVGGYVLRAIPLPAAVFTRIPFLDNTIAARYSLYVMLGAAVMFALILEALRERLRSWPVAGPACLALAVISLLPLVPAWPYWLRVTQAPSYFSSAQVSHRIPDGSVAVMYPLPSAGNAYPMLWQVEAGLRYKSPGGRFVAPPGPRSVMVAVFDELAQGHPPVRTPALRAELIAQLNAWQVRTVLVTVTGTGPAKVLPFFTWFLGRHPDATFGGIAAWYFTHTALGAKGIIHVVKAGIREHGPCALAG